MSYRFEDEESESKRSRSYYFGNERFPTLKVHQFRQKSKNGDWSEPEITLWEDFPDWSVEEAEGVLKCLQEAIQYAKEWRSRDGS